MRFIVIFAWLIGFAAAGEGQVSFGAATVPEPIEPWRIELVAEAPAIRHPSVVACAPDGRIFVAEDPMDITAPADAKLGRILCLHPDGKTTVFATNLHAVFGLQYLEGKVYVLHNPKFSVFRDENGVGARQVDLIEQTNPNPWALDWNDHIPANFRLAMDGYFYVAVGDKGLYQCTGRDGSTVNLHGGGILRMRPDATELEVFSTGVRNILDVAINAEDELFTYDNTDEHQWMGRLTHMVDGGFYGYPHDFIPQRPYTLWMMHDFGAGAACGAFAYNEDALPEEYRQSLFLSDFGKRQVFRVQIERSAGTYRVVAHEDLFRTVPEDFRPVGIGLSLDGASIYICDWQHRDTKTEQANVGRLWKLTWNGSRASQQKPDWWVPLAQGRETAVSVEDLVAGLSHGSQAVRMTAQRALSRDNAAAPKLKALLNEATAPSRARVHALWALDALDRGATVRGDVPRLLEGSDQELVRQAVRWIGTRRVEEASPRLVGMLGQEDDSLRFWAATALGRISGTNAVAALQATLTTEDLFPRYATFHALNRIGTRHPAAWTAMLSGINSRDERVREGTLAAVRSTYAMELVDALIVWFRGGSGDDATKARVLELLGSIAHQLPEWKGEWWAYHPAKAPAPERTQPWQGTPKILAVLRGALSGPNVALQLVAIAALGEARDRDAAAALRTMLASAAADESLRVASVDALARITDAENGALGARLLRDAATPASVRLALARASTRLSEEAMLPALIHCLRAPGSPLALRLAAIEALGRIGKPEAVRSLREETRAATVEERRASVRALGQARARTAVPELMAAWGVDETREDAFAALCRISDIRALGAYVAGLGSADASRREVARKALEPIRREALLQLAARNEPLAPVAISELRRLYANDSDLLQSPILAGAPEQPGPAEYERYAMVHAGNATVGRAIFENLQAAACVRCHVVAGHGGNVGPDLSLAGAQFSRAQLIESVLYPSRAVREGYQQIIVETRDDETVAGALKADTGDGLTLVDASGRTNFVPRASIANRRTSELSLMPEGIQAGMSLEEFAGLIAYLETLRPDRSGKP